VEGAQRLRPGESRKLALGGQLAPHLLGQRVRDARERRAREPRVGAQPKQDPLLVERVQHDVARRCA
jgi:hypothetical protein